MTRKRIRNKPVRAYLRDARAKASKVLGENVSPRRFDYWHLMHPEHEPPRDPAGRRLYSKALVARIIRDLLALKRRRTSKAGAR